jgi:hypothetical protein
MIKSIKQAMIFGIRAVFHNFKFITLFWIFNAASSVVLSITLFSALYDSLGRSLISDTLTSTFDYFWFLQFRFIYELQLGQIPWIIYSVVVIYVTIQTFFLGGLIAVFHQPAKNHTVDFFYGGVKYFYRFLKVMLVSVIFYAIAFKINDLTGDCITWLFQNSENAMGDFILRSLRYVLLIFLIGVVTMLSDYSKISLAVKDRTNILREIYSSIIFIKNNFYIVFFTFLFVACLGALGVVIYNIFEMSIPRTPFYMLIISFILQQMLIIFRLLIRMLFCSTAVVIYKDINADFVKAEVQ